MQDATGFRTYVEEIPEHDCQLDIQDVVEQVLFGDGFPSRRRRCLAFFQRMFLLSRKHPYTSVTFKSTNSITQEIMRHWRVAPTTIHPYSEFRSYWEIVLLCYYIVIFVMIPYNISFYSHHAKDYKEGSLEVKLRLNAGCALLLFGYVEIFVHFFTGYVSSDGMDFVLEKSRIATHYLKTFFFFDFISSFPYGFVLLKLDILSGENVWIEYLASLKLVRIISMISYYRQMMQRLHVGYLLRQIIATALAVVMYLHWIACMHLMASLTNMDFSLVHDIKHQTEEEKKPLGQQTNPRAPMTIGTTCGCTPPHSAVTISKLPLYLTLLFLYLLGYNVLIARHSNIYKTWFVKAKMPDVMSNYYGWFMVLMRSTCNTFGIRPPLDVSQIIDLLPSIIFSLLGIVVTSLAAVQVVVTARKVKAGHMMFEELQNELREYLRFKKVPHTLNHRISQYFRLCYERSFYKEPVILSFVSGQLRQDVLLHKSRRLLETVEIFAKLPPLLALRLVSCMKEQVALRNEVVVTAGTAEDRMHYILTGTVAVYSQQGTELMHLYEGDHFGEAALVAFDVTWALSVVALEPTRLWTLTRDAFRLALAPDKEYLQRVEQVARVRHGLLSGQGEGHFRVDTPYVLEHLRQHHQAAQLQRRQRARQESRFKSFDEHTQKADARPSEAFPRQRRGADVSAPPPTPLQLRKGPRRPSDPS